MKQIVRNSRFFLRPVEDYEAGPMTSVHSLITLDKEANELRGTIYLRDCNRQIRFEFWGGEGAWPGSRERAANMLGQLRGEIDAFMRDYDQAAGELDD